MIIQIAVQNSNVAHLHISIISSRSRHRIRRYLLFLVPTTVYSSTLQKEQSTLSAVVSTT